MKIYLGLGSNLGDRRMHLERAISRLKILLYCTRLRISPIYETPALLLHGSDPSWNKPYLNLVIEIESDISPKDLLAVVQLVEAEAGRTRSSKWAPRELDVDVLLYGEVTLTTPDLLIPHSEIKKRAFVLDPLKDLNPHLKLPHEKSSVLSLARGHSQHAPLWMGILNVTPDSFSDGGACVDEAQITSEIQSFDQQNVSIIDVGGESTRPGATPISAQQEWGRVKPVLDFMKSHFAGRHIRPKISVDTRHFETTVNAIEHGVDFVNDVSGLADSRIIDCLRGSEARYVLTHSLSVPADPSLTVESNADIIAELKNWFSEKIELLISQGIATDRIVLDPGIGFGKTSLQSLVILQNVQEFFSLDLPILIGHSRKSFLNPLSSAVPKERDLESVGVSLAMAGRGVDILRVHKPGMHIQAFRGWSHVQITEGVEQQPPKSPRQ